MGPLMVEDVPKAIELLLLQPECGGRRLGCVFLQRPVRARVRSPGAELLGGSLPRQQGGPAAVAPAQRRCDRLLELDLHTLRDGEVE